MCGFENPIRGRPSEVQQALIVTRLENLLWRMLVPQVNARIVSKLGTVESIDEKLKQAEKLYKSFFDGDVHTCGTTKQWLLNCYDVLGGLLPIYFKNLLEVAPKRRIMELLLHANVALPFTEMHLLMHIVS